MSRHRFTTADREKAGACNRSEISRNGWSTRRANGKAVRGARCHELTAVERQKGHGARTPRDRRAAGKKGWATRIANGGFGLTQEERLRGARASAEARRKRS